MTNRFLVVLIAILLGLGVIVATWQYLAREVPPPTPSVPPGTATTTSGLPRLSSPASGDLVVSPLVVRGEAPGNWFFEANLPLRLTDDAGHVLAQTGAQALDDWMTSADVPFSGTLIFATPTTTTTGFLVVAKDNPSGLPEHDAAVSFPVRFVALPAGS